MVPDWFAKLMLIHRQLLKIELEMITLKQEATDDPKDRLKLMNIELSWVDKSKEYNELIVKLFDDLEFPS